MKFQLKKILPIIILFLGFLSTSHQCFPSNRGMVDVTQTVQKIAVIIDTPEFYDEHFIADVTNGFKVVNQTYISFDVEIFALYNYSTISHYPYQASYSYAGESKNHTELVTELLETDEYDIFFLMGYELRRSFLDISIYSDTKFIFYDLSGEFPETDGALPDNGLAVSFDEAQVGFIAGVLAVNSLFSSELQQIAIIGAFDGDPRSTRLIAGFQGAIIRENPDAEILISYVDDWWEKYWVNYTNSKKLANQLETDGYSVIFSALQNNNTMGILDGVSGDTRVITVDSNRTNPQLLRSIVKNNTKVILHLFQELNRSATYISDHPTHHSTYGLGDNVFYPSDWKDDTVNETMSQIYEDVVINKLEIPGDIKHAENTPGFELITLFVLILSLPLFRKINYRKRKR